MNKKATRLLSVLLAVLMVVTMVPFMALSAAEPVQNIAADPVVWDGKVPASSDGTVATVEEWIFGTGAAEGKTYDFNWSAEYAGFGEQFGQYEHIEFNGTDTITIKTAAGLALFTVWSNVNTTTVQGMGTKFGNGAGMTHPLVFLQGKTVKLAADLYLNDPAVDAAEWTNTTMPIFWDGIDLFNDTHVTNFTFDGQGYMIYGWKLDQTIAYDETNCGNNAWGFFGMLPTNGKITIKSLALIDAKFDLDATIYSAASTIMDVDNTIENVTTDTANGGVCTVYVGGIYGEGPYKHDIIVENCVIDVVQNIKIAGQGTGSYAGRGAVAFVGGITGISADYFSAAYKEAKAVDGVATSKKFANDRAAWRVARACLLFVEQNIKGEAWGRQVFNAGVAVDSWQRTMFLDDIIVASFLTSGNTTYEGKNECEGVFTVQGNVNSTGYTANRGLVTCALDTNPKTNVYYVAHDSNKQVSATDLVENFATAVQTEITDGRASWPRSKTFESWTTENGYPLPMNYNAAEYIASRYIPGDPVYRISTPEDFMAWKDNLDKLEVVLENDIDMAGYDWSPIQTWGGTFDGQGHVVYNLTSTPASDNLTGDYHAEKNMRGGLVNVALDGLTFKNVAFMNYHFKSFAWWAGAHQGMLFAYYSGANVKVENVIIAGRNNGGTEVGMFGGRGGGWSGTVTINNCAFICTDPAKTCVNTGWAQASYEAWNGGSAGYGGVTVNNFYAVNLPDYVESVRNASYSDSSRVTASNIYATGAKDRGYYSLGMGDYASVEHSVLTYADVSPEFYAAIEGDEVTKADMVGSAMDLGDGWTYADGLLPVPKCFDASVAELLTATNGIKADDAADYLTFTGASIRLSELAEKQGIRFSFATTAALDLLAKNADVMYGVLVAPTARIGDELDADDEDVALLFANLEGGDAVLDVVDGKFNAALVNFAGVTTCDVRKVSFTVRGFVIVGEEFLWLDSYACSAADVAKAYIAENAGSEDAEIAATIEKIEAIYSDLLAE